MVTHFPLILGGVFNGAEHGRRVLRAHVFPTCPAAHAYPVGVGDDGATLGGVVVETRHLAELGEVDLQHDLVVEDFRDVLHHDRHLKQTFTPSQCAVCVPVCKGLGRAWVQGELQLLRVCVNFYTFHTLMKSLHL